MRLALANLAEHYAFIDPAGSKSALKRVGARSAIVTIAVDDLARIFVLEAWAARCSTDHLIDRIFEANVRWHPRLFGCEANALQSLFADAVRREARATGKTLPLIPVQQPVRLDKDFRIRAALQPVIAEGRLFVQETQHDLKVELVSFPMSQTKDLIDALASVIALVPPRRAREMRDAERESRLRYLRESGAPVWFIEQVAEGVA